MDVAQQNRDLGTRSHQHHEHEGEEAEDIVDVVEPKSRHNEVKLDRHGSEWKHAAHHAGDGSIEEPRGGGDLAGDLVGAHWERVHFALVAVEGAEEDQRHRHAEPQEEEREEGGERHGATATLDPQNQVDDSHDDEGHAREQEGREQRVLLPLQAAEHLVRGRAGVASEGAHEDE